MSNNIYENILDSQEFTVLKEKCQMCEWLRTLDNVTLRLVINVAYPLII